jgi:hypothetical protein
MQQFLPVLAIPKVKQEKYQPVDQFGLLMLMK